MIDQKPLPEIPASYVATLSVDSQAHRSRLIRHLLSDVDHSGLYGKRNTWAHALEEALDDLGRCLSQGGWLSTIKCAREVNRNARHTQTELRDTTKGKILAAGSADAARTKHGQGNSDQRDQPTDRGSHLQAYTQVEGPPSGSTTLALKSHEKRLLLCVSPLGTQPIEFQDISADIACIFVQGAFPPHDAESTTVLYGPSEWATSSLDNDIPLIGGTFTFKGVGASLQHQLLSTVLRMSIYVHLSMILEQCLLSDSHVPLVFPRPKLSLPSTSLPGRSSESHTPAVEKQKKSSSFIPSGILSFFTKSSLSRRSNTIMPVTERGRSLDMGISPSFRSKPETSLPYLRSSEDGGGRSRAFSFLADRRPSMKKPVQSIEDPDSPFTSTFKQIEDSKGLLSTSPGVAFSPPALIVDLAEKERQNPTRRLNGDEKAGLLSILGWDGRDSQGKGMSGTLGFLHQQAFSVLRSQHVPTTSSVPESLSSIASTSPSFVICGRPSWETYHYYSPNPGEDMTLGEMITDLMSDAQLPCDQPGCHFQRSQHELRLIHGGLRINVTVGERQEGESDTQGNRVDVWQSCAVCGARCEPNEMSDGTHLISFGKFLELLVYSPMLCSLNSTLCEHTTPPLYPWSTLPESRLNIIRSFSLHSYSVSFSLSTIGDIFELRVPRLQISRGSVDGGSGSRTSVSLRGRTEEAGTAEDKKELRREIKRWWEGIADHIDRLETVLDVDDDSDKFYKALPRLPSTDSYSETSDTQTSAFLAAPPLLPPTKGNTPSDSSISDGYSPVTLTPTSIVPLPIPSRTLADPLIHRLSSLRHTFHRTEQSLYSQLSRTSVSSLNDVRSSFIYAARGAHNRLMAWQRKHISPALSAQLSEHLSVEEPEWWGKKCYAVPGGNVVVREDDWGSIISFTLSTADYQHELANMSVARTSPTRIEGEVSANSRTSASEPPAVPPNSSSFFSAAINYRLFTSSAHAQPDPDQEDVTWSEPEAFSSVISRKEHPRDTTTLLSFREVLRQKSPPEGVGPTASHFSSLSSVTSRLPASSPPSAWAKPDVQVNMEAAGGEVSGMPETLESAGRILRDLESASESSFHPGSRDDFSASSKIVEAHIHRRKSSSIISVGSDVTVGQGEGSMARLSMPPTLPETPTLPPKDNLRPRGETQRQPSEAQSTTQMTSSSFASTLTSGLNSAMRFMLNGHDAPRPTTPLVRNHHGLLSADAASMDERPHIKYDWTIGKRLKFSCTVYYAKQFDALRRRCGIDDTFLRSLSRSTNWAAKGGKSRSNFWKTSDERFIIKTLVDAWNVADLQVLIELAPSYFRYMDATAGKATVLAKLIGFYTVEIRNLESGAVQAKADLLVMENLFYDQNVVKTFDLKGIQGRKVKARSGSKSGQSAMTLFDGEWIEGQQRALMLVRPHSAYVLRAAIKSDADFLSKSNIMDYSLLVGVDEERKQIACGLVDTIGSYSFAKTLEYKAKHGLNSGKDITVMPPAEYQERFVSTLEGYFLACPDKWSKPRDESTIVSDPNLLPSVL